jgi:hypothetical protein
VEVSVQIVPIGKVFNETGLDPEEVTLLSLNCEGCEVALLETLLESGFIERMPEVQMSWHPLPAIPDVVHRRCLIRTLMTRTHTLYYSFHFSWESWVLKGSEWF